jgi:hypothetical protein
VKSVSSLLLFLILSITAASADTGLCALVDSKNGPYRCPIPGCGQTYSTYTTEQCNSSSPCDAMFPVPICCGRLTSLQDLGSGTCLITEMRDDRFKSRILEFAEENEILVPTCSGAYVPARIAFRQGKTRENGGL